MFGQSCNDEHWMQTGPTELSSCPTTLFSWQTNHPVFSSTDGFEMIPGTYQLQQRHKRKMPESLSENANSLHTITTKDVGGHHHLQQQMQRKRVRVGQINKSVVPSAPSLALVPFRSAISTSSSSSSTSEEPQILSKFETEQSRDKEIVNVSQLRRPFGSSSRQCSLDRID